MKQHPTPEALELFSGFHPGLLLPSMGRRMRGEPDIRAGRFEKLLAQSAAPKLVNGFHLQENGLPLLKEIINWGFHGRIVFVPIQYASTKALSMLLSSFGLLSGHAPKQQDAGFKPETRNPKWGCRRFQNVQAKSPDSAFGLRISFGFRILSFGFRGKGLPAESQGWRRPFIHRINKAGTSQTGSPITIANDRSWR